MQRGLLLALIFGLVVAAFVFPSAFAQELKGSGAFVGESLKGFVPLMVGLGTGLGYFIYISIRRR